MDSLSRRNTAGEHVQIGAPDGHELTITDVLAILRRRRDQISIITLTCLVLGVAICIFMMPRYEGRGVLEIQKTSTDVLRLQNIVAGNSDGSDDALNANLDLQTDAEILQSDELALKVIENLHLEQTRDFQPKWSPLGSIMHLFAAAGPPDTVGANLENSPQRRTTALKTFAAHLKVKPIAGTRLIEIRYLHSDRHVAPAVVNDLIRALKEHAFQTRYAATTESSRWLNAQLADLKEQTAILQAKFVDLQKDSGVYSLGPDSHGRDQFYSSTLDRLQQATAVSTTATSNRILKGAVYEITKKDGPELISSLAGGSLMGASAAVQSSFTLLQTLRSQQSALQSQLAQDSSKFGSEYPKLADERSSLESVTRAISDEVDRIGKRAENDYLASQETEDRVKRVYAERKAEADRLNDKTIAYGIAKQEADDSRGLYDDLFKRLKEAGIVGGFPSSNITIVEPGRVPATPAKPNVPIYMGVSLLSGLFVGICAALFIDSVDTNIHSIEEMEQLLESPLLVVLPKFKKNDRKHIPNGESALSSYSLNVLDEPDNLFTEALRGLRTKLLHPVGAPPCKVILVTSSLPGEGKSTVSVNLAALLAQSGKRVLLVEADMRHPSSSIWATNPLIDVEELDKLLGIPRRPRGTQRSTGLDGSAAEEGQYLKDFSSELSVLLADTDNKLQSVTKTSVFGMELMPAGPTPRFPAELLDSDRMRLLLDDWKRQFDYVVLDSPPLLAVTDAAVLSHMADATLLVARPGFTSSKGLQRALERIKLIHVTKVGVVLNAVDRKSASFTEYYGHPSSAFMMPTKEGSIV
jgi:polysaccharide biosynthesis transport protein